MEKKLWIDDVRDAPEGWIEARREERLKIYDWATGHHIKAKKAYGSSDWDAGFHDALFDLERYIAIREKGEQTKI